MDKYKFTMLDVCTSDFFQGHNGPVLAVPVEKHTTKSELTDLIHTEYNSYDFDRVPDLSTDELARMCDEFILMDKPFITTLEETPKDDDCCESCYMYFTVTKDE